MHRQGKFEKMVAPAGMAGSISRSMATMAVLAALSLFALQTAHAQTETVLYNFCSVGDCVDGLYPNGPLVADAYATFYGTTLGGGTGNGNEGGGTVFGLFPEPSGGCEAGTNPGNGWCEYVLYSFCSLANCADGYLPKANVAYLNAHFGRPGNLYGTTYGGGTSSNCTTRGGCGIVFELFSKPILSGCPSGTNTGNGWCEAVLYNFCALSGCSDGANPSGNLVEDSAGNLYGTVASGVFELSRNGSGGWNESLIYSSTVVGGLAIDSAGNLYGVEILFNPETDVFKLSHSQNGWIAENIHTFDSQPGGLNVNGSPVVDSTGNVYGTTVIGGAKDRGTVWKLIPVTRGRNAGTYKKQILYSFNVKEAGWQPKAGVTLDSSGNIYGTTNYGGGTECAESCGTVFELAAAGATYEYKLLWSFDGTDGSNPTASLSVDSLGNLYGTAGTLFEVVP